MNRDEKLKMLMAHPHADKIALLGVTLVTFDKDGDPAIGVLSDGGKLKVHLYGDFDERREALATIIRQTEEKQANDDTTKEMIGSIVRRPFIKKGDFLYAYYERQDGALRVQYYSVLRRAGAYGLLLMEIGQEVRPINRRQGESKMNPEIKGRRRYAGLKAWGAVSVDGLIAKVYDNKQIIIDL